MNTTVDTEGKVDFKAIQSGLTPEQKSRKKRLIMVRTTIFCVLPLLVVLNLLVACHKTDPVAPEIEFSVNDTVEYILTKNTKRDLCARLLVILLLILFGGCGFLMGGKIAVRSCGKRMKNMFMRFVPMWG